MLVWIQNTFAFVNGLHFLCVSCVLFTRPSSTDFSKFLFKIESHSTIHTFKNYFATVFSIYNKWYPIKPIDQCVIMCICTDTIKNNHNYMVQFINFLKKIFKLYMVLTYTFLKPYISKIFNSFSTYIYIYYVGSKESQQRNNLHNPG